MTDSNCPCGGYQNFKTYMSCCKPLHDGESKALTPEQLMRSRYSAFATQNAGYLLETLHPSKHTASTLAELQASFKAEQTQWQSLKIVSAPAASGAEGFVEFVAFYSANTASQAATDIQQLHEHSRFVREEDRWFYIDGKHLPDIKLGRNDPCWCGSGKKLKKCHA